jgi:hypothetical protein
MQADAERANLRQTEQTPIQHHPIAILGEGEAVGASAALEAGIPPRLTRRKKAWKARSTRKITSCTT